MAVIKEWERSPLYQICLAVDMAYHGIKLNDKMLWIVDFEETGNGRMWRAHRECGSVLYSHNLTSLRKLMIEYEKHIEKERE